MALFIVLKCLSLPMASWDWRQVRNTSALPSRSLDDYGPHKRLFCVLAPVSIEMDNPFGDDDNDFDNLGSIKFRFVGDGLQIVLMRCISTSA